MEYGTRLSAQRLTSAATRFAARVSPTRWYDQFRLRGLRGRADEVLAEFSIKDGVVSSGTTLVDAQWDNPNYWIRYALARSALGLSAGSEVGLLGRYNTESCHHTLERMGIRRSTRIASLLGDPEAHRKGAEALLSRASTPDDVLRWQLPHGFPADFVYDGLLKRQRAACVDLGDRAISRHVAEALASLAAAERFLDGEAFDLLVLSHAVNFQHAAIAWLAIQRGILVLLLFGNYGVPRFSKLTTTADLYDTTDRPPPADFSLLAPGQAEALSRSGEAYLRVRRAGETSDIGARYAFRRAHGSIDRRTMCRGFQWDPSLPIVAVYASNWFDFPHACGMTHFRDFLDWLQATVDVAVRNKSVNWLFKAHPCDEWYGGVTLSDLLSAGDHRHIRLARTEWNASSVMECTDALVTYHSTAGIEYAAIGKPVLLADRGWYHDLGIARWSKSRGEYLDALARDWWRDMDLDETTRLARVFAGWYFCRPAWQGDFVLDDDSVQWPIYERVPELFSEKNAEPIGREVETIRQWFPSSHPHYHTFKMSQAEKFVF